MIKIIGVRFRSAGKAYYFDPKDLELRMGDHVIAETSKGLEYGVISTCMKMVDEELVQQPLRSLNRKATKEDEAWIEALRGKEREAMRVCREKVREHGLDMKMVDAEYSFDGSKVLFYFTADGRVDFRNLVKDLAGVFHVRIELRQIGVRDETRMLGGIGICGRELCCATFLRDFQPVSIKMAKEQNLSLNPAKISGTCGRLMCCLKNEEATYEYLNARMPKMGEEAITADGQVGKVVELDVLRQRVRVLFEEEDTKEIETFAVADLTFRPRKKKDPSQQGKKTKGEKGEKGEKAERGEKAAKGERANREERPAKGERADREERPAKGERADREERPAKGERAAKGEKPEKGPGSEKGESAGQGDRPETGELAGNRIRSDISERSLKTEKGESADRPEEESGVRPGHGQDADGAPEASDRPEREGRPEKRERSDRQEKAPRRERGDRREKTDRGDRTDRGERPGRNDRTDRGEKSGRNERADRGERPGRNERADRGERSGRNERTDRGVRPDRTERSDRPARAGQGERADRPFRGNQADHADRSVRGSQADHAERPERAGQGDRADRSGRSGQDDRTDRFDHRRPRRKKSDSYGKSEPSVKSEAPGRDERLSAGTSGNDVSQNAERKQGEYRPRKAEETGIGNGTQESGGAD